MKSLNKSLIKPAVGFFVLASLLGTTVETQAQTTPFGAGYFQNQYLLNPAMAGLQEQLNVNAGYRKESTDIPGSPSSQYLTGDYGFGNQMGAGLHVVNDEAGLLRYTTVMGSYSYYIPLDDNGKKLHLGISAGVTDRQLNNKDVSGEQTDPLLAEGNSIDVEGSLGIAYTDNNFTVQAAFPNMVSYFKESESDLANRNTYFVAASYKVSLTTEEDAITLEPKVAYRGINANDDIIDVGANLSFSKVFNIFGMYHTSKSLTAGAGITFMDKLTITAMYNTSSTELNKYTSGNFEIGVGFSFWKK